MRWPVMCPDHRQGQLFPTDCVTSLGLPFLVFGPIPKRFLSMVRRVLAGGLVVLGLALHCGAQPLTIPFTSGPIPPCDTSTFTANVAGIGTLYPWGSSPWGTYSIYSLAVNITTDHPEYLQISLTSPAGTTLLLSAFNGAGGQNYTGTNFITGGSDITTGNAPFTGFWSPQGGDFTVFDWEDADGTWVITVIDTACVGGPNAGPGGGQNGEGWNPGWFDGTTNSGGFTMAFNTPPPPCIIEMGWQQATICAGATVDVLTDFEVTWGGGGSVLFSVWDPWTGASVADPYGVATAGTYQIEGYDWAGCVYIGTYTVLVEPGVVLGPDQAVDLCSAAGPVDLTALFDFTGATSIIWSLDGFPIATSSAASATVPGVYGVAASNNGCNDAAQVVLTVSSGPALGANQTVNVCAGDAADLTALYPTAGPAATWTLDGSSIAPPIAATAAGVYEVSDAGANGCISTAQVTMTLDNPPALGPDQAASICSNTTLDLTAFFATDGMNVAWTFAGAPVVNPVAVQQAGAYQLVAITAAGCTDTALVAVNVLLSPMLGMDLIDSTCEDEPLDLTGFFPTAGLTTSWTFGGMPVPDPTAVIAPGGYTLVVTDANACTDTAQITVELMPVPVLGPDQSLTGCDAVAVDLTSLYATGADATAWTLAGAAVTDPTAVTEGGIYTLTVTTAAGCSTMATVTLQLDPSPALGGDLSTATCAGTSTDLTALFSTTGLSAEWTWGGAPVADPSAVTASGAYQLVVTNGFNCTDTAVVNCTVHANPDLGDDLDFALCPWQTLDLSAVFPTGGMMAAYTLNGAAVDDATAVADSGDYVVRITDANGCTDEAMAQVTNVPCLCAADFTADARCIQEPVRFAVVADSAIVGAQWSFGGAVGSASGTNPEVMLGAEGELLVTMTAQLSCGTVTVERTITLQDCADSCAVYIPNAFTPNDDERNDAWSWVGDCDPEEFLLMVFDRWGELIYATEDPLARWDGTYQGTVSQDGVYVYRVRYRLPYQARKDVIGHVTLLR